MASKMLIKLDVSYNSFSGSIPGGVATISTLEEAHFEFNQLTSLAFDWSQATSLTYLSIHDNQMTNLTTTLPPSLTTFRASNNPTNSSIPQSYMDHDNLQELDLTNTGLVGDLPWPAAPHHILTEHVEAGKQSEP
jgi:Leucine-rich repeat (LRR) protein